MGLLDTIGNDFKEALRKRRELEVSVLRMLKAALTNKEIELRKRDEGLPEEKVLEVISSELKKRRDAEAEYRKGGRTDLADKERNEQEILMKYMPAQLTEEEIRSLAKDAILKSGAETSKDFGKVMSVLMPRVKGKADGEIVSRVVKEFLPSS